MGILDFLSKPSITDPFYDGVKLKHISLYQHVFEEAIKSVDIDNCTNWARGKKYNEEKMDLDVEKMQMIIFKILSSTDLESENVETMIFQYFFADVLYREVDKKKWVERVLNRKKIDYFPSGWALMEMMNEK